MNNVRNLRTQMGFSQGWRRIERNAQDQKQRLIWGMCCSASQPQKYISQTWLWWRFLQCMFLTVGLVLVIPSADVAGCVYVTLFSPKPDTLWAEVVCRGCLDVESAVFIDHHARTVAIQPSPEWPVQCLAPTYVLRSGQALWPIWVCHFDTDSLSSTIDGGPRSHKNALYTWMHCKHRSSFVQRWVLKCCISSSKIVYITNLMQIPQQP